MNRTATRRDKLRRLIRKADIDALLVSSTPNVTYLTGFTGDSAVLVLGRDHELMVSDGRYSQQIQEECAGLELYVRRAAAGESLLQATSKVIRRMKIVRVAYESSALTVAALGQLEEALPKLQWTGWTGQIEQLRWRKDAEELRQIREAIAMAQRAFEMLRMTIRPQDTEKDAADQLETFLRRAGAQRSSFQTIVAAGARAALPHARPGSVAVGNSALLLVDWGARGKLYNSDLTRVLVSRRIPTKLQTVYKVVLRAQRRAIERIRPGIRAKQVDAEARAVIGQAGFGRSFTHSTGHGVGLEVHEAPVLGPKSETVLEPGMVVTVEPGIYCPGWGGVRIEDMVLVTRDGHEILSSLPKNLDALRTL